MDIKNLGWQTKCLPNGQHVSFSPFHEEDDFFKKNYVLDIDQRFGKTKHLVFLDRILKKYYNCGQNLPKQLTDETIASRTVSKSLFHIFAEYDCYKSATSIVMQEKNTKKTLDSSYP